jgi:hypothetical protein
MKEGKLAMITTMKYDSRSGPSTMKDVDEFKTKNTTWYEWYNGRYWTLSTGAATNQEMNNYTTHMKQLKVKL